MNKVWKKILAGVTCAAALAACPPTYGRGGAAAKESAPAASAGGAVAAPVVPPAAKDATPARVPTTLADCELGHAETPLIGPGKLTVRVPERYYLQYQAQAAKPLHLLVDGVDVSDGTTLYAFPPRQADPEPRCATFEYQFKVDASTGKLWAKLYREHWMTDLATLRIRLVPANEGEQSPAAALERQGAVTTPGYLGLAFAMMVAVIAGFLWLLLRTDTFRDRAPAWLALANANRADYLQALSRSPEAAEAVLGSVLGTQGAYLPANAPAYMAAANRMRQPRGAPTGLGDQNIAVGLLLQLADGKRRQPLPQVSYSLARVQTGVWFTFLLASAIFLAAVFWQLPVITGSLLGILGITVANTAVSFKLDQEGADAAGTASDGLLNDIVTGRDDRTHVYRYQAVAVNLLLVCYGVGSVLNDLQLPSFDNTWLAFLGLSATFAQAGKQSSETEPSNAGGPALPAAPR